MWFKKLLKRIASYKVYCCIEHGWITGKYCRVCGKKAYIYPQCSCGNELTPNDRYCDECGKTNPEYAKG